MSIDELTVELRNVMALPEPEIIRKGLLALVEKEIRAAENEIAEIRERYDFFTKEDLSQAIQEGRVAGHPAWEDYIVWKNKEAYIERLHKIADKMSDAERAKMVERAKRAEGSWKESEGKGTAVEIVRRLRDEWEG